MVRTSSRRVEDITDLTEPHGTACVAAITLRHCHPCVYLDLRLSLCTILDTPAELADFKLLETMMFLYL